MKKVLVITCILAVLAMSAAMASDTRWGIKIVGSNPTDWTGNNGSVALVGVGSLGTALAFTSGGDTPGTGIHAAALSTSGSLMTNSSQANWSTWTAYVAANSNYTADTFRINIVSHTNASLAVPGVVDGKNVKYVVTCNGVTQTFHATDFVNVGTGTVAGYFDVATAGHKGVADGAALQANGYMVTITQAEDVVVPEPSSMLALGSGLVGLAGFVIRRRRA